MECCKLVCRTSLLPVFCLFILCSCGPSEHELLFSFDKQAVGVPFSFAQYCENEYDSIYVLHPYANVDKGVFAKLKMSDGLRGRCRANTNFDYFSTLLFVSDGVVEAYSEPGFGDACFSSTFIPEDFVAFPFEQCFVLNENRYVSLCK